MGSSRVGHWKFKSQKSLFVSKYERDRKGERVFVLTRISGKTKRVTFESHEAAKKLGWVKQ